MKLETSRRWGTTTFRRDFLAADDAVPDVAGVAAGSCASYRFSTIGSMMLSRLEYGGLVRVRVKVTVRVRVKGLGFKPGLPCSSAALPPQGSVGVYGLDSGP